ncbi:FIG002842: hypothetical protein [hydrothermal vent metagenome]|uniref:Cell division protein ZapD n=1 Tax=hydrothermal vent metagenome TaxID=652676 RepID=A0A3B0WLM3_9ZZZZ
MPNLLIYEQPLSETIRSFLRLENLFRQYHDYINQESGLDSHNAIKTILEILSMLSRYDIKRETIKELKRQSSTLQSFIEIPGINHGKLSEIINQQKDCLQRLHGSIGASIGHELQQNELLNAIRQRMSMPGGLCEFDLPVYAHWLHQPVQAQLKILNTWFEPFLTLNNSINLILQVIRDSNDAIDCTAEGGFYQKSIDNHLTCLMIRVILPEDSLIFPEISAGKHRFTIRFLKAGDLTQRPEQSTDNVEFKLSHCVL